MNILVTGNGFDLEHGLPTSYEDFLEFLRNPTDFLNKEYISKGGYDEILRLCSDNFWV